LIDRSNFGELYEHIDALTHQIRRLQEAHDLLLPKLMSGALDLSGIAVLRELEA
jgi:hypothetical protein